MVVIRLQRRGAKKKPYYRIVVQDKKKRKEGAAIEWVGSYNPARKPKLVQLNKERIDYWIQKGAKLSPTVQRLYNATTGGEA